MKVIIKINSKIFTFSHLVAIVHIYIYNACCHKSENVFYALNSFNINILLRKHNHSQRLKNDECESHSLKLFKFQQITYFLMCVF